MNFMKAKKGAAETKSSIQLLIALILIIAVLIPVTVDVIANLTGVSGTTALIINLIPLFLGLLALVRTANAME